MQCSLKCSLRNITRSLAFKQASQPTEHQSVITWRVKSSRYFNKENTDTQTQTRYIMRKELVHQPAQLTHCTQQAHIPLHVTLNTNQRQIFKHCGKIWLFLLHIWPQCQMTCLFYQCSYMQPGQGRKSTTPKGCAINRQVGGACWFVRWLHSDKVMSVRG